MKHLQEEGKGPTSANVFLKSVGFFDWCFRFISAQSSTFVSTRALRAARAMASTKRSLKQAPLLSTAHVYLLERCVVFGGFVLFCLYASGRFTDSARIREVSLERCENVAWIKSLAYHYNKSTISERRNKALPHQALAVGLHNRSWGTRWLETRKWLKLERFPFLMPAMSHKTGEFIDFSFPT